MKWVGNGHLMLEEEGRDEELAVALDALAVHADGCEQRFLVRLAVGGVLRVEVSLEGRRLQVGREEGSGSARPCRGCRVRSPWDPTTRGASTS